MWPNLQFPADLVTLTREILNGNLHFLCSDRYILSSALEVLLLLQYLCSNWLSSMLFITLLLIWTLAFFITFIEMCEDWGRRKLYMDLWWRGSELYWICTAAPLWMWYRELLHTSGRWPILYTRYGLQRYANVLTTLTQQGC